MVILLVRDNSRARTGRVLLNQFVSGSGIIVDHQWRDVREPFAPLCIVSFLLLNKFLATSRAFVWH